MASNEHKNLNNANLHPPLDFSTASNSTILSKNSTGSLEWTPQAGLNTNVLTLRGFCTPSNTNYYFPSSMFDTKASFEFLEDYGAASISAADPIAVNKMIRSAMFTADKNYSLSQVYGWVTGKDATETVTFALCKGSNVTADESNEFTVDAATNTLVVLDEFTALTYASNSELGLVESTDFTVVSLSKGDFLLPMIKSAGGANDTYFSLTIQLIPA